MEIAIERKREWREKCARGKCERDCLSEDDNDDDRYAMMGLPVVARERERERRVARQTTLIKTGALLRHRARACDAMKVPA